MSTLFVGWDVAGWTCPSLPQTGPEPDSQDALVVLGLHEEALNVVASFVGNMGKEILAGTDFVRSRTQAASGAQVILAIDAPLGWPNQFNDLLGWSWSSPTPPDYSPLLYRETDRFYGAQSAVVRAVGSASTKALAYLQNQRFNKNAGTVGVFTSESDIAIETYPKVVKQHAVANPGGVIAGSFSALHQKLRYRTDDEEAALWCALVAAVWGGALRGAPSLTAPPATVTASEGWIWAP